MSDEEAPMPRDVEGLKAKMMVTAEEVIDNLLAGVSTEEKLMLSDIERSVRAAGQRVMKDFTQELVDAEAEGEGGQRYVCPRCGEQVRGKGQKERRLETETGEVRLKRSYCCCSRCREGFFPPRPTVGTERDRVQPGAGAADGMDQ
jgi:hypothetical protein